jgi:AcrR family transcriptional regulator
MLKPAEAAVRSSVEETRHRILTATREIYAEKGTRGTTTREVADRADFNEATLFRHFGTKGQLLSEMLEYFGPSKTIPMLLQEVRGLDSLEAQLEYLGLGVVESMRQREDLIKVTMAEELANPGGMTCAWRGVNVARGEIGAFLREKVERRELSGDPDALTRLLMSLFFAYVMARKIWSDTEASTETVIKMIVHLFLNGARVR